MAASDPLPILLIIAEDIAVTDAIIKEVVRDSQTEDSPEGLVWLIRNKYYEARVLLRPVTDAGDPPDQEVMERVEAFIIYIQNSKGSCPETAARRLAWCGLQTHGDVRLIAADAEDAALEQWAWAAGVEPVWWPDDADRAREALHSHTWRGLRELREAAPSHEFDEDEDSIDEDTFSVLLSAVRTARQAANALPPDTRRRRAEQLLSRLMGSSDNHL